MKRFFKYIFLELLYIFYSLLVKSITKGKKTLPSRYLSDLYEVFPSLDSVGSASKIALPYVDVDHFNRHDLNRPYEVLHVDLLNSMTTRQVELTTTNDFILPVALLDNSVGGDTPNSVGISYGDQKVALQLRFKNRFHYLPIKSSTEIDKIFIQSDHELTAVGAPIYRDKTLITARPKLIVHIFVDALSKVIIDSCKEDAMPATTAFFSDGVVFENAYSQADWTLSSISGVFTGKYTKDHLNYHPRRGDKLRDITIAEVLNEEGYLTSSISAVPKLTPINGFDKGFSRCVIAPYKDANYIINEAIEQLDAFGGNQYLFLGLFDVHEAYLLQPISSQVNNSLADFNYKLIKGSKKLSVLYDKERAAMYTNTLKHFDSKLETLYKKIDDYDEDAVVVLHSDHGVDFTTKNTQRLSNEREKVPLMIKGGNISSSIDRSCKEIREVSSMILSASNIEEKMKYTGSDFVKTESLYPNQEYELAIRNNQHVLFFQVPWSYVRDRVVSGYQFTASLHCVGNELHQITNNESYDLMVDIAKNHYAELINNIIIFEDS